MFVLKRNGQPEEVKFDKVTKRIKNLCKGLDDVVVNSSAVVAQKVFSGIVNMISTQDLDTLASRVAADMVVYHPHYGILAGRLSASNLRKKIKCNFSEAMEKLFHNFDDKGEHHPVISEETYNIVQKHKAVLDAAVKDERDMVYDVFGIETLKRSYLLRTGTDADTIMETPQYMNMRVAIGVCGDDIDAILDLYEVSSRRLYTHATPTLFNAGTTRPQMASCFLVAMKDDSIDGIFDTIKECANISKYSGGIGIHVSNIRSSGSLVKGTNGKSNGLIPFLKIFNDTAVAVDQGGGKRRGSFAIYIEPHHADVEAFLELGNNTGPEDFRARALNLAMWVSNLFLERVFNNEKWSLMDPNTSKGLENVYGDEYKALYERYEAEGKFTKQIDARDLLIQILNAQIETGYPYMVNKDECNKKSNQQNLGTIKSSNLCVAPETLILTEPGNYCPIHTLVDQKVNVWNGEEWSPVTVRQTGINQPLIKVCLSNGVELECTRYHKFYIHDGSVENAENLVPGMKLIKYNLPTVDDGSDTKLLFDLSNGTYNELTPNETMLLLQTVGVRSRVTPGKKITILDNNDNVTVIAVIDEGRTDDTYCFTEKKRGMGMFAGVLTGNCSEIVEYSDPEETATCNLASVCLPRMFDANNVFDYDMLTHVTRMATRNLNKVIDRTFYPVEPSKRSNMKHRPIGIGITGLHDVFHEYKLAYDDPEAKEINRKIFETMYRAAILESIELAKKDGPYTSFKGSPMSNGIFQFDMWKGFDYSSLFYDDWEDIRKEVVEYGIRNSLLLAVMPTGSTATIMGVTESIEIATSNIYSRKVLSGEYVISNKYMVKELSARGMWSPEMATRIMSNKGSLVGIDEIPNDVKHRFRTVWEYKMKEFINMSADRSPFICQSQSLNMYMRRPTIPKMTSMVKYAYQKGLKTISYYFHSRAKADAMQFTVEKGSSTGGSTGSADDDNGCLSCSA